jgi:hypothetical protein
VLNVLPVRQKFPPSPRLDLAAELAARFRPAVAPGATIAVGVGSRGISSLALVVKTTVDLLKRAGAAPFLIPAMGSHGGATPEGQAGVLAEYGVTEASCGAPVRASMETRVVGRTEDGVDVHVSVEALKADGVVLINRVKPHTDFGLPLGSGILKMLAIGLGKKNGAVACHEAVARLGHERVIRTVARVMLPKLRFLAGVALLEDARHATAKLDVLGPDGLEAGEELLQAEAKRLMPALPFDDCDLLVVDRLGKNVSGAGMDPNIIGRPVHGYSTRLRDMTVKPVIRRLYVRELTPETHGNAIGLGMADATTARLVRAIDPKVTLLNAWTALSLNSWKIPPAFETDREALEALIATVPRPDGRPFRYQRVADTLSLETVEASDAFLPELSGRPDLEIVGPPRPLRFDAAGNLLPIGS